MTTALVLNPETILAATAHVFHRSVDELCGKGRAKSLCRARHVAMYLLTQPAGGKRGLTEIGKLLGNRNHTTVLSGVRKTQYLLSSGDAYLTANIDAIWKCAHALTEQSASAPPKALPASETSALEKQLKRQSRTIKRLCAAVEELTRTVRALNDRLDKSATQQKTSPRPNTR